MKYKRVYTDSTWWLTVFQGSTDTDLVLIATISGAVCIDVALKLSEDEANLFRSNKSAFITFAKDFGSRDRRLSEPFERRKIEFTRLYLETIETEA